MKFRAPPCIYIYIYSIGTKNNFSKHKEIKIQKQERQEIYLKEINLYDVNLLSNSLIHTNFTTNQLHNVRIFTVYVFV
jgi:hypothetical protein